MFSSTGLSSLPLKLRDERTKLFRKPSPYQAALALMGRLLTGTYTLADETACE